MKRSAKRALHSTGGHFFPNGSKGTNWLAGRLFVVRNGYTLLELMLVLGILLVLAGIAWPAVQRMYERHRLQTAAEDVRAHLAGTRLRAINSGLVYQFTYEPGGRSFSVSPFESTAIAPPEASATLPEQIQFDGTDALTNSQASLLKETISAQTGQQDSSIPILFTPDGSAIDSAITLTDDEGRTIRLSVRGLTAAVTVGTVQQRVTR